MEIEKKFTLVEEATTTAGAATYWELHGDLTLDTLKEGWEAAGLSEDWLPEKPSAEVAFRRAMGELSGGDIEVEQVETTGEWLLQSREEIDGLPVRTPLAKWKLDNGTPVQTFGTDALLHEVLIQTYEIEKQRVTSTDASKWLRWLVEDLLDGVALRWNGGFYYIPPVHTELVRLVKRLVKTASAHNIYLLPMLKNDDAVESILHSLEQSSADAVTRLIKVLEENADGDGPLGHKRLKTLASEAAAMKAKMDRYAKMLGAAVPKIADTIESLSAGLFAASSKAERANG